jgi:hypothetical protein
MSSPDRQAIAASIVPKTVVLGKGDECLKQDTIDVGHLTEPKGLLIHHWGFQVDPSGGGIMLTGNFTAELNVQKMIQVRAEVGAHRAAVRAAQTRRHTTLSRPAVVIYRKALSAVALSVLLVVGMATAALAMPQVPEVFHKSAKASHAAAHLRNLVGPGSATDAWLAAGVFMAVALLLAAMTGRSRRRSAVA